MLECLIRGSSTRLTALIRAEGLSTGTLAVLDQLVTEQLRRVAPSRVTVVLKSLELLSNHTEATLSTALAAKVLSWFRTVRDLLTSEHLRDSAELLTLTEAFYDYFLVLSHNAAAVSQLSVVLLHLAESCLDTKILFALRLEAIRTFNSILESLSREKKRRIQTDQNHVRLLHQVAAAIPTAGDYELQVSLSESLCRLTPKKEREHRASRWFSSCDIIKAFCDIKDRDFEVDCRRFLNMVNSSSVRVHTFPCLRAFLDSTELFGPKDEKLEEFWIDFNMESSCVSFFIDEPQGFLWGSVHLQREDVGHHELQFSHDERGHPQMLLVVQLKHPIVCVSRRGQTVKLIFNPEHQRALEAAAEGVFMEVSRDEGGTAGPLLSSAKSNIRSYKRKKPASHLKVLPLSSPSSGESTTVIKSPLRTRAEFLYDEMRHSTPSYESGLPVGLDDEISMEDSAEFVPEKEVFKLGRKRLFADSGYQSDGMDGRACQSKEAEAEPEDVCEESQAAPSCSADRGYGRPEGAESKTKRLETMHDPRTDPESDMMSSLTDAFTKFKTQLEQHITGCWQKVEADVLPSLRDCEQHVSSLLTAVHQSRLFLLQRFEKNVEDQLTRLEENFANLNSINADILSFFQAEVQRLESFCDENQQRLKSLQSLGAEPTSSQ